MNAVRWSPDGRFLATGSGDGRVGIAERSAAPSDFGAGANAETWRLKQYFTGASMGTKPFRTTSLAFIYPSVAPWLARFLVLYRLK